MSTSSDAGTNTPLSTRLRTETQEAHSQAEHSGFVADLLDGKLPREAYAELLAQSYLIYRELEAAGRAQAGDRVVDSLLSDDLLREQALEADLAYLRGADWRDSVVALPATERYVERIRTRAGTDPVAFAAHHYIRYLGDLSGGQVIRRRVGDAYGLTEDGVRFYIFDRIPKPKPFKDAYRDALDAADFTPEQERRLIDEVNTVYALNRDLFDDLAGATVR